MTTNQNCNSTNYYVCISRISQQRTTTHKFRNHNETSAVQSTYLYHKCIIGTVHDILTHTSIYNAVKTMEKTRVMRLLSGGAEATRRSRRRLAEVGVYGFSFGVTRRGNPTFSYDKVSWAGARHLAPGWGPGDPFLLDSRQHASFFAHAELRDWMRLGSETRCEYEQ